MAYATLADAYIFQSWSSRSPGEAMEDAREAATRALEIDDTVAEAYSSLGVVKQVFDWDWLGAERAYERALELDPSSAVARQRYADVLAATGRCDEAVEHILRARELDPLSPFICRQVGEYLILARRFDQAAEEMRNTLRQFPGDHLATRYLSTALLTKGDYQEAIELLEKTVPFPEARAAHIAELGYAYALAGKRDRALHQLRELERLSVRNDASLKAFVYTGLGDIDSAFEWLTKALDQHEVALRTLKVLPGFDPLRSDPRFQDLLRRMNLSVD